MWFQRFQWEGAGLQVCVGTNHWTAVPLICGRGAKWGRLSATVGTRGWELHQLANNGSSRACLFFNTALSKGPAKSCLGVSASIAPWPWMANGGNGFENIAARGTNPKRGCGLHVWKRCRGPACSCRYAGDSDSH